jgi:hypothetical protein
VDSLRRLRHGAYKHWAGTLEHDTELWDSFLATCKRLDNSGDVARILGGTIEEKLDTLRHIEGLFVDRYPRLPRSATPLS